jgi:transcriptional regulator with XRE-family HTH domain
VTNPQASDELKRLVRSWRLRLNPDELPGLNANQTRNRRHRRHTVSQEMVANLIGYTVGWYSSLERGESQNYSTDFLDRVAYTLRLTPTERRLLFLYAAGHEPATQRTSGKADLARPLKPVLDAQPWPAYISDEAWDVVDSNQHMRDWFPWVSHETNVMRWVFTYPEARNQLYRWETDWAPQMLAQVRTARARMPHNQRLNEVLTEILQVNPDARRLWDQPLAYLHPDGDRRSLYLPYHRKVKPIQLVALEPMRAPGSRIIMLVPNSDADG